MLVMERSVARAQQIRGRGPLPSHYGLLPIRRTGPSRLGTLRPSHHRQARRPLMAFVMVLSYSRQIFLRFFLDARLENFLRGHLAAFEAWQGVARVILYDNLKSAVLERQGDAIRFNPTLLEFAGHYRYEPRPVAIRRGNEKGRVERAIRYVRDNFFAARSFAALDDLNAEAEAWCLGAAADRRCPQDQAHTVREVFAEEGPRLLRLPDNPYPVIERVVANVGKTPYVRFDLNDYSVPHTHVRRPLTVLADPDRIRIIDGEQIFAIHRRSYDKGQPIEDPAHLQALVDHKRAGRRHHATDRLSAPRRPVRPCWCAPPSAATISAPSPSP